MTEPTWTPWLENPGTGENPVPEFSEKLEYEMHFDKSPHRAVKGNGETVSWGDEGHLTVVRYRYAIPADLAWLAKNVDEWTEPSSRILFRDENGHPVFCYEHKDLIIPSYTKAQWLRARQDLGCESGIERFGRICAESLAAIDDRDVKKDDVVYVRSNEEDDPVNHPSHYMLAPELEAIDVIRASLTPTEYMGYLKGSILKYRLRAGRKGEAEQDIAKSDWYRERAVELERQGGG